MSLQLDARQRAMLQEMGVRLFWPEADADIVVVEEEEIVVAVPVEAPVVARAPHPRPLPRAAEGAAPAVATTPDLARLDWDALQQHVQQWAAARRRKAVFGTGDTRPDWLCIGDPPIEDEERQGAPFAGDVGKLLDNMLAAVGASRSRGAYLTNVLKARLPEDRSQQEQEVADSLAFLRRQVQLLQPKVILAMGRFGVQMLLQSTEPLGRLRGTPHTFEGVPVVVTFHPSYLLRTPQDKARAWADLCLAQALVKGS